MRKTIAIILVWALIGLSSVYAIGKIKNKEVSLSIAIAGVAVGPGTAALLLLLIITEKWDDCVLNCKNQLSGAKL